MRCVSKIGLMLNDRRARTGLDDSQPGLIPKTQTHLESVNAPLYQESLRAIPLITLGRTKRLRDQNFALRIVFWSTWSRIRRA